MTMKVEMDARVLEVLFKSGLVHPSDVRCLDHETKDAVKQMCLELCQPSRCHQCDRRMQCAHVVFDGVQPQRGLSSNQVEYSALK
ncbi:hypothetical protein QCB44_04370 [Thiomicrorhabdus sp. zzn3]|uniref:hypothetical protein n=1 Tax=Thiomicrorhabdus sp. zzn3 TaxID=3039775 RepID=UPI00243691FC|nr:hypothetical protein [Thiomicrorhabdus sp. zzn3]MDG6777938.1 hypothetical protein [Thiomicrorhabdus sp. zzn3]